MMTQSSLWVQWYELSGKTDPDQHNDSAGTPETA
jgi:hypothetical protein